jgi:hypothetical protein
MRHQHPHRANVRPPLQKREIWLIIMVSLCLVWTTWALGGVRLWGQLGTLFFALASGAVALWPSPQRGWANLRSLLRFVPFWLGLFVAAYITVQALNPSWALVPGANGRLHASALDPVEWLPSGVSTPWYVMNPWRMLLIFLPCWIVTCAVWCGSHRPMAMRAILWVQVLNCFAFAVDGILQSMTHATRILWLFDTIIPNVTCWGTIANPNHAAAFMNLGIAASLALFVYYTGRHGRDFTKGGSYLMLMPLSVIIAVGVFQAMSRAGILVAILIFLAFLGILGWRLVKVLREGASRLIIIVASCVMLTAVAATMASMRSAVNMKALEHEMRSLVSVANDPEKDTRYFINRASIDLFELRPAYGWGAGCYRYFINHEQRTYPLLMNNGKPISIVFAHNDYMNSLCDLGVVGSIPLFAGILCLPAFVLLFRRRAVDGAFLMGLAGILASMLHSTLEFFMQHPLVALQFAILLTVITRMACLDHNKVIKQQNDFTV